MAAIKNLDDFDRWLASTPVAFAQVLAARIAMRVLPLYTSGNRNDLTLIVWRASFISWAARSYPAQDITDAAEDAARAADSAAHAARDANAAARAAYAVAHAAADAAADSGAAAARAAYAAYAADTAYTARAVYAAIMSDTDYLDTVADMQINDAVTGLLTRPLWPDSMPRTFANAWTTRKAEFNGWGHNWDIWADWYDQRLKGSSTAFSYLPFPYDDVTLVIAMENNGFWQRIPGEINTEIKARLDAAKPPITDLTEPLPGYYHIEIENDRLTAKPVAPETAQQEFARDMLEALRELVDDTRSSLDQVQDDLLLTGLLDRLGTALTPEINDLRIGRLVALRASLAAQAAAHDDQSRESHSTIRGALNGLSDTLENLLAQFEAVREAKASQIALQITTTNISALDDALDQFTEIVAQSDAVDLSVLTALNTGQQERTELDILASPIGASPQRIQAIASQMAELNGQRLVAAWNITERLKRFSEKELVATGKMLIDDLKWPGLISLLVTLHAPLILICTLVPSFIVFKRVIENLQGAKDKSKDHKSPPAA